VRELIAFDAGKPTILTETGAVKPRHTGCSELYAKEKTLKILGSLPYDSYVALENSNAELLVERSEKYRTFFLELLKEVVDEATLAAQR